MTGINRAAAGRQAAGTGFRRSPSGKMAPMTVVRRLARPLLASMFIVGGFDAVRNPKSKVGAAEDVAPAIAAHLP